MKLNPKLLAALIITSFVSLLMTGCEAHRPETALGLTFWVSFGVFVFCCMHLSKNDRYYSKYIDELFR